MNQDTRVNSAQDAQKSQGDATREVTPPRDSDWIAEVSHELRLPIANIKLLVETLLEGAADDPSTAMRMLERTRQEVERLEALVLDLISIEEVAGNRDNVKKRPAPLAEAARYAKESVGKAAAKKSIVVITEIEQGFTVNANPDQLNQVMLNLVENAVKYTASGGEVIIKSGPKRGCFSVSDNGIGIPVSEIPKIFKRFYRVDRTRAPGSTGLGLSIVKHIVDLHGAKISVQSQESKGSTFYLQFPEDG
ncbi:MAG: HAMP domain-containing histidine kinase [Candidatus Obscuribacterales bacterium]|nr:HAMP domain-containing histidine kinase [Candidatus Obscuribacterales bacterium]